MASALISSAALAFVISTYLLRSRVQLTPKYVYQLQIEQIQLKSAVCGPVCYFDYGLVEMPWFLRNKIVVRAGLNSLDWSSPS